MKQYFNLLPLLIAVVAFSFQPKKSQPLKLIEASSTHWAGGIAGRSGTNFSITVTASPKSKITFDSIWIKGEGTYVFSPDCKEACTTKKGGDTTNISVKAFHVYGTKYPVDQALPRERSSENPFSVNGQAVLRYKCCGKTYYLAIAEFKKNPAINYP